MAKSADDSSQEFARKKKQEEEMQANKMKQKTRAAEEADKEAYFRNKIEEKRNEYAQSSRQAIFGPSQVWREFFELIFSIRDVIAIEAGLKKVDGTPSVPQQSQQELRGNYALNKN
jgi:hypothetical protein